jgi:hypothetical protein
MEKIKFSPIALIALFAITFASCTKDLEENLPGAWRMSFTATFFDIYAVSQTGTGTFNEDGTGTWTLADEDHRVTTTEAITWNSSKGKITISDSEESDPKTFNVIVNKDDEQEWYGTLTEDSLTVDVLIKLTK